MPYLDSSRPVLPFQSGSDTCSRDAAVAVQPQAETLREKYLAFMQRRGALGATDAEAERLIPMKRQTVCPRRAECIKLGLVTRTDQRRRGCRVWIAVER